MGIAEYRIKISEFISLAEIKIEKKYNGTLKQLFSYSTEFLLSGILVIILYTTFPNILI